MAMALPSSSPSSSYFDTTTLIHIGIEVAVVCGVAFFLYRKINEVDARNVHLQQRLQACEHALLQQQKVLQMITRGPPDESQTHPRPARSAPRGHSEPTPRRPQRSPTQEELDSLLKRELEDSQGTQSQDTLDIETTDPDEGEEINGGR